MNTEAKYKTRVRSRVANLKDSRNPKLRENVLIGLISCDRIASMTAEVSYISQSHLTVSAYRLFE